MQVLEAAAQELSSPAKASLLNGHGPKSLVSVAHPSDLPNSSDIASALSSSSVANRHADGAVASALSGRQPQAPEESNWRATVEKRIAQKTRRFAHVCVALLCITLQDSRVYANIFYGYHSCA